MVNMQIILCGFLLASAMLTFMVSLYTYRNHDLICKYFSFLCLCISIYSFGYTLFVGIVFNFLMGVTASRLMLKSIARFKLLRRPWLLGGERA
jgi:hypothetical protein